MVRSRRVQGDRAVPVWYHSLTEEEFSDVQSGSFDQELHTVSSQVVCVLPDNSIKLMLAMFSFPVNILHVSMRSPLFLRVSSVLSPRCFSLSLCSSLFSPGPRDNRCCCLLYLFETTDISRQMWRPRLHTVS